MCMCDSLMLTLLVNLHFSSCFASHGNFKGVYENTK